MNPIHSASSINLHPACSFRRCSTAVFVDVV
jgi:hypothetical protein